MDERSGSLPPVVGRALGDDSLPGNELRQLGWAAAPLALLVVGRDGVVEAANRSALGLGFEVGRSWSLLGGTGDDGIDEATHGLDEGLEELLAARRDSFEQVVPWPVGPAAGHLLLRLSAIEAKGGAGRRAVVSVVEVTPYEQARLEAQLHAQDLEKARNELRRRNEELDEFNSVVSHDLKEPLRTIRSYGKLLRRHLDPHEPPSEKALRMLGFVTEAAGRAEEMVGDFLRYARSGREKTAGPCSPSSACEAAIAQLRGSLHETGATVEIGDLPAVVAMDHNLLVRILQNLIGNAVRFSEHAPQVSVQSRRSAASGFVTLCVRDRGRGVPDEALNLIFHPFHRLDPRGPVAGNGIGLAICRRLVTGHGGVIWAENADPGLAVCFDVPLAD